MGDQDDKQWLYDNGHMTMSGGKVSMQTVDGSYIFFKGQVVYEVLGWLSTVSLGPWKFDP